MWKFFLVLCMVQCVLGHSWIACTKYSEENGVIYDDNKCDGYPRDWESYVRSEFGGDGGYNQQVDSGCGSVAIGDPTSSKYSGVYPMATYARGERVCLAWPSKNHVASLAGQGYGGSTTCATPTNEHIPDGGIKLFVSAMGSTDDTFPTEITPFGRGTHTDGTVDYMGFQNCPEFCDNNDKSMCTGCFTVPNLSDGEYSFKWEWVFNPGTPYVSCWEARIEGSDGGADGTDGTDGTDGNDGTSTDGNDGTSTDGTDGTGTDGNDGNDGTSTDGNDGTSTDGNDGTSTDGTDGTGTDGNDGNDSDEGGDGGDGDTDSGLIAAVVIGWVLAGALIVVSIGLVGGLVVVVILWRKGGV